MQDMDVDSEMVMDSGPASAPLILSSPRTTAAGIDEQEQPSAAEQLELSARLLLALHPDEGEWSFELLAEVNMDADLIDACKAITGYPEAQIVLALMICILGPDRVGLPADVVAAVPAALLGGLRVIIVRS
jgi:hypothetical protein